MPGKFSHSRSVKRTPLLIKVKLSLGKSCRLTASRMRRQALLAKTSPYPFIMQSLPSFSKGNTTSSVRRNNLSRSAPLATIFSLRQVGHHRLQPGVFLQGLQSVLEISAMQPSTIAKILPHNGIADSRVALRAQNFFRTVYLINIANRMGQELGTADKNLAVGTYFKFIERFMAITALEIL